MREIKFEYLVVFESGEVKKTILTLEEIEKNSEFSSFGQAIANVANGVKEIYRRQYTGLKDKNGVKIYEGDIVKINSHINIYVGSIEYSERFVRYIVKTHSQDVLFSIDDKDLEVIGNIYENPELLENV